MITWIGCDEVQQTGHQGMRQGRSDRQAGHLLLDLFSLHLRPVLVGAVTHWRKPMDAEIEIVRGQPGKILVLRDNKWVWVEPQKLGRPITYVVCTIVSFVIGTAIALVVLYAVAKADEMPGGLTCRQARYIALSVGESTTWNRERARSVAASYGYLMTESQLDELAKCFDPRAPNHNSKGGNNTVNRSN
jgi:hypothetical protein